MPRILYTVTVLDPGAVPNILFDLAPHLNELGWEIEILALQKPPRNPDSLQRAAQLGITVHHLGVDAWNVPLAVQKMRDFLKSRSYDLVHSHLGRADLVTAWAKPKSMPQVSTFHSVRQNYHPLTLFGYRLTDHRVNVRTGVSQAVIDSFYAHGFLKSRHQVIYNPVDPQRLACSLSRQQARELFGVGEGPALVQVGRLISVKAHQLTLRALALLRRDFPNAVLIVLGDGPLRAQLQHLAKNLGIDEHVRWVGFQAPPKAYAASDLVVFPSLWEGLGLVPIEAMLLKIPVVCSDLPAIREFLNPEEDGLVFPPGQLESYVQAIQQALHPTWNLEKTQRKILERFNPRRIAQDYHNLYISLGGIF